MKNKFPSCPYCGKQIEHRPKVNFWTSGKNITCSHCGFEGGVPLKTSEKILCWTITALVVYIVIGWLYGQAGWVGFIGLIAPLALYNDSQSRKKLLAYEIKLKGEKKCEENEPEKNGVTKGIVYSLLIVILTFGLGIVRYNSDLYDSSSTTNNISNDWQMFNSTDGKFGVLFPSYPSTEPNTYSANGVDISSVLYAANASDGSQYAAQYAKYSIDASNIDAKAMLEGAVNGSVSSDKANKLISSDFTTYREYSAIDFLIYNTTEKIYLKGRNIIVGNNLYTLFASSSVETPADYQRFVGSFNLR